MVLLRCDSETTQRKYSYVVLEYEALKREHEAVSSEMTEMTRNLREHILFLETSNARFGARLEAQQAILDKSVPYADFEMLSTKVLFTGGGGILLFYLV